MKIIGLGSVKISLLYPFLASLLYVTRYYFISVTCNPKLKSEPAAFDCKKASTIFVYIFSFGELANVFFVIVSYCLNKSTIRRKPKAESQTLELTFNYIPSQEALNKPKYWQLFLIIFLTSCIYIGTMFILNFLQFKVTKALPIKSDLYLELRLFNFFFIAFFCYFWLFYPIYKHQKFSLIIVAICSGIIVTVELLELSSNISYILIIICTNFIFCIREVLHKYLMEVKTMSSVWIVFLEGVFNTVMSVILTFLTKEDALAILKTVDWSVGRNFLIIFFCCFLYDFFAVITKYYYEPVVMAAAYSLSTILWNIYKMIVDNVPLESISPQHLIFIIVSVLSLLSCIIYNEIVILYCCNLERDTRKEIISRSNKECNFSDLDLVNDHLFID